MRNREEDRARWNDPEFNKWLDDAISDAGHSVWDAIPDIGSAWNGWDACKSATGYYCPVCNGSGEELHLTGAGPDAYEILGDCHACEGDGRASVALAVAQRRIIELCDAHAANMGQLFMLDRLKAENEALRKLCIELRGSAECHNVHHCKAEQHEHAEPCKVLARIDAAISQEQSK